MDESAIVLRDSDILEGQPLGGAEEYEPLFVINLCAAMTPLNLESNAIPGFEQYKLYQVSRMEDGRRRYRLRLGFFTTESSAEDVLCSVRQRYATAFTSCLADEDLKHASGYLKRSVQDLARTGRFKISKPRDPGATGMMRALTPSPIVAPTHEPISHKPVAVKPTAAPTPVQSLRAMTPRPVQKTPPKQPLDGRIDGILELDWSPAAPKKTPVVRSSAKPSPSLYRPSAAPASPARASTTPVSTTDTARLPALKDTTLRSATLSETGIRRPSLMQQAHAMASVDAADRAKVMATLEKTSDASATGRFKTLPPSPDTSATGRVRALPPTPDTSATGRIKALSPTPDTSATARMKSPVAAPDVNATGRFKAATAPELTASTPPITAAKPAAPKPQTFHVGAGVEIPETSLTLEGAAAKPTHVAPIVQAPHHTAADNSLSPDLLRARELAKQSALWRQSHGEVPTLDTTQTIRTLTKNELEDLNRDKWFTVQLAISDQPANLDTMPRLDIFEAYSLYSVATMDGGHIRHALRLGFFREEVSAEAVMGYLRTFFHEPTITRISDAEHERFKDTPKITPVKAPTNVVPIEQKRVVEPIPAAKVPTINTVARPAAKSVQRSATATKRANAPVKKPVAKTKPKALTAEQQSMVDEARLLGLSDTQIIRVQKNPSLLSRLVGKLRQ